MTTIPQALEIALQHHHAGRMVEAEAIYRQILAVHPNHPEATHLLGVIAFHHGHHESAVELFRQAVALDPGNPTAYTNLGAACCVLGQRGEGIAAIRRALDLKPDYAEAHNNLGNALREEGQAEAAATALSCAIELKPDYHEAHNNLAMTLQDRGNLEQAIDEYRRALLLKPDYPEAHNNLGAALQRQGRSEEAIREYRAALQGRFHFPEARNNLANALLDQGRCEEALAEYRCAIEMKPAFAEAHNNLGHALRMLGRLDEAITASRRALELKPGFADAYKHLGNTFKDQGQIEEAIAAYRRAVELKPENAEAHSNLIYILHFQPRQSDVAIAEEQDRWNRRFSDPAKSCLFPHERDRNLERALRVGYVSSDLRNHVIGRNVLPLFRHHDRGAFEIVCYSGALRVDHLTGEFRRQANHWRDINGVEDEALAAMIREDGVDILVDLTQHMAGNRLPVFAHQPAPVQVSFAGYPESTGVEAIRYRISDRWLEGEGRMTKEAVWLLDSFWCYDPCGVNVEVNDLPAKENGGITFGSLNNFCKVNDPLLKLWARVLRAAPDSRLLLLSGFGSHRQRTLDFLAGEGIEKRRIEFVEMHPRQEYLKTYYRLDIVLDTFPYNGHTTSLDALWMGVPVVNLAGECPVSRAGLSQLSNLGLPELIAHSEDEYVEIAARLAGDLPRLAELRRTLRARMEASVLMDAPRFARNIEAAYRAMWRQWCEEGTRRS